MSLKNFAVVTAFPKGHGPLYAQNYPTKVITVIVPFVAGADTYGYATGCRPNE